MTNELSKALLKQNGLEAGSISQQSLDELKRRLVLIQARARRMKWRAVITWICFVVSYVGYGIFSRYGADAMGAPSGLGYFGLISMVIAVISLPAALVFTTFGYALSRGATLSEINVRLAHLEKMWTNSQAKAE